MYLGHFVEVGERHEIFLPPRHLYTELSSPASAAEPAPSLLLIILERDIPEVAKVPSGVRAIRAARTGRDLRGEAAAARRSSATGTRPSATSPTICA